MAIQGDNDQIDQNNQQQQPGGSNQQPPGTPPPVGQGQGSSAPTPPGQGPAQGAYTQPASKHTGSGFTNLQNIIGANQGNQLGNTIGSGIQNQAGQVKSNLQNAQQQFNQQSQQNNFNNDNTKNYISGVLNNLNTTGQGPNAQDIQNFSMYRSGAYAGPKDLGDISTLQGQAQSAEQLGQATQSQGGRQALLQQFVGNPQYNQGQQRLDSLLLGQGNNMQQLAQARLASTGLQNQVNQAQQGAQGVAQTYQGYATDLSNQVKQQLQAAQDPWTQSLNQRAQQAQDIENQRVGETQKIRDILKQKGSAASGGPNAGDLSDTQIASQALEEAAHAGYITPEQLQTFAGYLPQAQNLGLDVKDLLGNYLTDTKAQNLTASGLITDPERAKFSALSQLSGQDNPYAGQTGGATLGQTGVDLNSLQQYLDSAAAKAKGQATTIDQAAVSQGKAAGLNPLAYLTPVGVPLATAGIAAQTGVAAKNAALSKLQGANQAARQGNALEAVRNIATATPATQQGAIQGATQGLNWATGPGSDNSLLARTVSAPADIGATTATNAANIGVNNAQDAIARQQKALEQFKQGHIDQAALGTATNALQTQTQLATDIAKGIKNQFGGLTDLGQDIANGVKDAAGNLTQKGQDIANGITDAAGNFLGSIGGGDWWSDKNLKKNIKPASSKLDELFKHVKPYSYDYVHPKYGEDDSVGVMAQDLEKSELGKKAVIDTPEGKKVNYAKLMPSILASQAELHKIIKEYKKSK